MEVPQLTSCCCGCSLKTGTKIIAWLQLIPTVMLLVTVIIAGPILYSRLPPDSQVKEFYVLIPVTVGVILAFVCGMATMLLMGAYQKRAKLVLVWVIIETVFASARFSLISIMLVGTANPRVLIQLIPLVVESYFILVVYNFYREIRNIPHHIM